MPDISTYLKILFFLSIYISAINYISHPLIIFHEILAYSIFLFFLSMQYQRVRLFETESYQRVRLWLLKLNEL